MKATGWGVFFAALAAILAMLGAEVNKFAAWSDALTPQFVGTSLMHIGAVVGAFVGGKMLPGPEQPWDGVDRRG